MGDSYRKNTVESQRTKMGAFLGASKTAQLESEAGIRTRVASNFCPSVYLTTEEAEGLIL